MMSPLDDFLTRKNHYVFNTSRSIDAPPEDIWKELMDYSHWPFWCRVLKNIEPLTHTSRLGKGNNIRSTWKGPLPYTVTFDSVITDVIRYSYLSFNVTGDLFGRGRCRFAAQDKGTRITFTWEVSPTKLWMRMSSPFARSLFIGNHNTIMEEVFTGFERRMSLKAGTPG